MVKLYKIAIINLITKIQGPHTGIQQRLIGYKIARGPV